MLPNTRYSSLTPFWSRSRGLRPGLPARGDFSQERPVGKRHERARELIARLGESPEGVEPGLKLAGPGSLFGIPGEIELAHRLDLAVHDLVGLENELSSDRRCQLPELVEDHLVLASRSRLPVDAGRRALPDA